MDEFASVQPRSVLTETQNQNVWPGLARRIAAPAVVGPSQSFITPSGFTKAIRYQLPFPGLVHDTSITRGLFASSATFTLTRGIGTWAKRGEPEIQRSPRSFAYGSG